MNYRKASWWQKAPNNKILCTLCPRRCRIGPGKAGFCYIRQNIDNELVTLGYGRPSGFAVDPIEKKPLSHFLPGSQTLSFGTVGCNLGCKFCQNWDMSKAKAHDRAGYKEVRPEDVVKLALQENCDSISFTYNEPTIFGEYVLDISKLARKEGIKTVMVTAGYISEEARAEVYENIDAANVDLKAFSEDFYRKMTISSLKPVLDTIDWLVNRKKIWVELTTLLIPELNDSEHEITQMCKWIIDTLGPDVPLHFTAFHPDYKLLDSVRTPLATLQRATKIAREIGIRYIFLGNVHSEEGQSTYCHNCNELLIRRDWHDLGEYRLLGDRCPDCKTKIPGVFPKDPPGRRIAFRKRV
ncbi:AmmeMemoRadiSam system radical SAM enzyme [Candidatus Riflebacteria bacterium]